MARDVPFSAIYWGSLEPIRAALLPRDTPASSLQVRALLWRPPPRSAVQGGRAGRLLLLSLSSGCGGCTCVFEPCWSSARPARVCSLACSSRVGRSHGVHTTFTTLPA